MEHGRRHETVLGTEESAFETMHYLAERCAAWPLVYGLVEADVQRWSHMKDGERRAAFGRTLKRVAVVAPWVLSKVRVRDAAETLGLPNIG